MKITGVKTLCLSRLHERERQWITARYRTIKADAAVVVVDTDEGIRGIGEACAYGVPTRIKEWMDWLTPSLIGKDPLDPFAALPPNGLTRAYDCAVAGLDCALWDIRGKAAGKRVSELLTERPLDRVPVYASGGCRYDWRDRPEQLIDEVLGYAYAGFSACKIRMGTEWAWDGVTPDRFLGLMRDLATEVDGRITLLLDGNQRLTEDQALTVAKGIDELGFGWFEEPVPMADIDAYARLDAAVGLPITGGEQLTVLEQFRPRLERSAYAIVQPDAGCCGITEALRIGEVAHRYGVRLCPHSWHNGLMAMANAHLVAALPDPYLLEVCMHQGPLQWGMLADPPSIEDGFLHLPDRPGLGVELADDLEEAFPYIEGHYAITVDR